MDEGRRLAWLSHRQGLDGSLKGRSPAEVLQRAGWARSVAGAGPYLALFARAGLRREAVDAAVAEAAIHELPAARGCTYVLPACDFALGLTAGQLYAANAMKVARRLGVSDAEIERLRGAVERALAGGPLDPDGIRGAVGDASRSLGEEGKKKGVTTTLPLALGLMQSAGEIRRIPVNGRLDQQRYKYALWKPNPLARWKANAEETSAELARRFFGWAGGAKMADFQTFSGLSAKAAKAATEALALSAAEGDWLMLPEDAAGYQCFRVPKEAMYALVGSMDNIGQLTGGIEMSNHGIVDRGKWVGLWDFDPADQRIVWRAFDKPDAALKEAVKQTEAFIREDLGDARSFSLDSPQSRVPRLDALRKAAQA